MCALPATVSWLQLIGAGITLVGLLVSWWAWTPAERRPFRGLWAWLTRGKHRDVELTDDGGASDLLVETTVTAEADTHDGTLEGRVDYLERLIGSTTERLTQADDRLARRVDRVENAGNEQHARLVREVEGLRSDLAVQVRTVALDGLRVAAFGVFVGMVGTFATLWPGVCP